MRGPRVGREWAVCVPRVGRAWVTHGPQWDTCGQIGDGVDCWGVHGCCIAREVWGKRYRHRVRHGGRECSPVNISRGVTPVTSCGFVSVQCYTPLTHFIQYYPHDPQPPPQLRHNAPGARLRYGRCILRSRRAPPPQHRQTPLRTAAAGECPPAASVSSGYRTTPRRSRSRQPSPHHTAAHGPCVRLLIFVRGHHCGCVGRPVSRLLLRLWRFCGPPPGPCGCCCYPRTPSRICGAAPR